MVLLFLQMYRRLSKSFAKALLFHSVVVSKLTLLFYSVVVSKLICLSKSFAKAALLKQRLMRV